MNMRFVPPFTTIPRLSVVFRVAPSVLRASHRADVCEYKPETLTRRCCHSLVAALSSKLDPHSHLGTLGLSDRHTEVNNHSTLVQ